MGEEPGEWYYWWLPSVLEEERQGEQREEPDELEEKFVGVRRRCKWLLHNTFCRLLTSSMGKVTVCSFIDSQDTCWGYEGVEELIWKK